MLYPVGYHIQLQGNLLAAFLLIIWAGTETDGPGVTYATRWRWPRQWQ